MTDYSAAAAALEVPESLVRRSAEARAKADNVSVDDLVAAWAGGGSAPAPSAPPPAVEDAPSPAADVPSEPEPAPAETVPPAPSAPAAPALSPAPGPVRTGVPPVLVGASQSASPVIAGAVGLLLLSILIGFLVPSLAQPDNEVRTSNQAFSAAGLAGQETYLEMGCASCHTQLIRAVVADARLGPVTLADTNQVVGYRRIGPDLAAMGSRIESTDEIVALLSGGSRHPEATGLSEESLANLLAYLRESG